MAKLQFNTYGNEKQKKALSILLDHNNWVTDLWYGWWAGWAKSYTWVAWQWMVRNKYPWTRWFFWRKELKRLKQTTLATYFKFLSDYEIPKAQHWVYNAQDSVIKFANGSEILLLDLSYMPSDPLYTRFGSLELTDWFADEIAEIDSDCLKILKTRIWRQKNEEYNLIPKFLGSFNPDKWHVYRDYYLPDKNGTLPEYRMFIPALATDNKKLPKTYIEQLERSDEVTKQRLLYGNFEYDATPGRLFLYEAINALWSNPRQLGEKYITCDVARFGRDKTVIILWSWWTILKIVVIDSSSTTEVTKAIQEMMIMNEVPVRNVICDEDGVGWWVVDQLWCKWFQNGSRAISPANATKVPSKKRNYKNLKTQCYFMLADDVNKGNISIKEEAYQTQITQEIDVVVQINIDNDRTLEIISKEEIKEKLGRSPDFSDAIMMREYFELKKQWPVWQVIQWKTELIDSFEIDDRWMLPEDIEEEETQFEEVEMSPY